MGKEDKDFTIEEFQKSIAGAVQAGMAEALLDHEQSKDQGFFYVTDDGEKKSFVDYLTAVKEKDRPALKSMKALEMGTGASGGFTVPSGFRNRVMAVAAESAIVRPRADVIEIGEAGEFSMPCLDQTFTPTGNQIAWFGGVELYWTEEGGSKTEAEPAFELFTLKPNEMAAYFTVTDRLLRHNAVGLEKKLYDLAGQAIGAYEDFVFLNGDGVGKPMGVIHSDATIQVPRTGATEIVYADILAMWHAFMDSDRGVWVIQRCAKEQIATLKDGNNDYIWHPDASTKAPGTLLGYPIIWSSLLPALGTKGDIILADFQYYGIGDGSPMTVQASEHYLFREDKTAFRLFREISGGPWLNDSITVMAGQDPISPFVTLDTYGA